MKKKPVSNTRTGKSNSVLRNFLTNLKENELHYENKQITQCVFLGVLRLKPVPSIFSSTNVPSSGASVVRSKPRKAKNNNSNKEVNKNVSKKTSINKVINGKITKKNSDKVKACVKKSPAKKSKVIKIKLNIDRNKSKLNMPNNSEAVTVESKNLSKLLPQNLINKQVVNQNSKTSTTFNPVDSLLNKLKQKIDVGCHSSGLGIYDVIDSIQEKQTESSTPVRRKLILPTKSKLKPKPMYHQPFTMPLSSSNCIMSNENSNMDKDDVIFVTDYKLGDSIVENISHSCDDVIFIDSPRAVKQKERTSPRSKVSNLQDPGLNGQHPRTATTVNNHILNDSGSTQNSDIIIISDDIKSRPSTPNDLIVVDDPRGIRVSPRSKKSVESYSNNFVTIHSKNKVVVISDQDLNKPECSLDKSRNQQLNLMIDDNVTNTSIDKSSMPLLQTVEVKKLEVSSNQKTVDEKILQKPVEKPKQRRSRLIAANIPSIFLNTPMLLRSELAQKKAATVSKPKNREKSHPRLLRSELPKNSLLSKSFSEQKVVRQDRIEMRKCSSQENVFVPEESETIYINGKSLISHKNIEQKKHSSPQIKNTSQNISTDRWEITKSTPNMEIKNQEMKSNQKPVSLKLTLTKTSKTTNRLPTPKEKSSKNQETQTERDIFVIESSNPQGLVKLSETVLNLHKDVDLIVANNPMYSPRLLRSDLNQKSPTLNCAMTNTKLLHNVDESTENMEIIVIPDDKKINEKCVETLKNVTDETQISPRLLRSNIPQQHIQNGKDTVATSSSIPQNISKIKYPAKDILIPEKINSEQSNSNSMQNSNTNSVYSRKTDESYRIISEKISKNIQSQGSFINQESNLLSEISASIRELKQDSSKSQESTTFAAQQNSVSPDNSMHPQKCRQYSNQYQDNATFITRQQSNISAYNSTSLHKLKQYSNQSQETTTLIPNQRTIDSTSPQKSKQCLSQSEESATVITTQKRSASPCNSTNPQEFEQSPTRTQASASLIISQQSTVSPQNSTSPEILKPSPKKSPIKNRVLQKKTPINFDEIVVLNEKRSKKSKEYPARLLRSDFHQPPTTKLSKVIEREEVVVLIHDEPKSKCLPSPKLSKIEENSNTSSECSTNNIVIKEISPIDSLVLTQKDIAIQGSVVKSNKIISKKEILSPQNQFLSPFKEFPEFSKNLILENNNNMMTKYKFENIETSNSPIAQSLKPRNDKLESLVNKSVKPLQSPRDTSIIEIEEVIPPRNLRSQKCGKSEDVMEIKKSPSQKSRARKDKVVTVPDEPIPQRILRINKDQKVENVFAAPVQKKNLRIQNAGNNVEAFSKLDEPISQRTLRSQKHEDIEDPSTTVNSNNHNVEIKLQCVNDNEKYLPKRILRSQNSAEQDVAVSKTLKKRERKSEKHTLSQNKVNNTSLTMVKQNAVRASKALVEKKLAHRDLRRKIINRAREFKNKTPTKSSNEKVIREIKDITILRTDKTRILRSKTIVHKKTRKNGNITSTIGNKKNEQGNRMQKKVSAKIESRLKCSKKRKCVLKFLPTKKVLRRKCKEPNKVMINRKPSLAVKISNRVRRKMFNNSMKSQKITRALPDKKENRRIQTENYTMKQMQNKFPKTKSKYEGKKVILASVIQKNPTRFPNKTIKNNPTNKLNSKHIKKNPDKNNLKNRKSSKDEVGKENEQKNVSKKNYKKSSRNQKSAVENCETIEIENEEKDHKELNKIVERKEVKEDIDVRENIVDESITKRKSDQPTSENVLSKRLRKTSSKVLHATVSTDVDDSTAQVTVDLKEVQNKYSVRNKAVSKRLRNSKNCLRETNDTSLNSVASSKTIIQQVSEVTEIQTKCTDCNKTIMQKIPFNKTNSVVDGNNSTVSKVMVDVVPPRGGDSLGNSDKNRDITVFDFNETELEPVVPHMRFNSPKKDKNSKIIEEDEVSEKYNKNYPRKLKLTEFSTNHDHLQTAETANASEENAQGIPRTEEVTKKKLYSRIEKPEKYVAKVKKSKTRTVVAGISSQNIDEEEISPNVKSKERLNTKEKTHSIKTEPKLYSLIEKPSKKSINIKATNTLIGADESLNPSRSVNGSSATPLAETNTDTKPSPKKSPMKQATITDMFNKMKLKKDQSSAVRNVFSPPPAKKEPTTVKSISKENSKESQSSSTKMPPPKMELPWNKSGDAEDEDSDCESRLEWMPEEYAEYKFKYTAKKLMTNKPIFQCRFCLLTLPSYYFLNKHKLKHLESDKPYKCQQCEETFSDVVEYTAHIRIHKGKHPYTCKKCDERFWTKKDYDAHMPVHILKKMKTPEKKYRCDVCGKTFSKLCDVERHTRVHTGEKPCVCNICNKRFQQSHNLSKHLLIHLDIKPFNCEICNKQFSRVDILDRHILTHSVKKPAMCQHCPKGFIRQSQLDVHMKKYHPNADRNIKRETVPAK